MIIKTILSVNPITKRHLEREIDLYKSESKKINNEINDLISKYNIKNIIKKSNNIYTVVPKNTNSRQNINVQPNENSRRDASSRRDTSLRQNTSLKQSNNNPPMWLGGKR
jgi:hypothetical protein